MVAAATFWYFHPKNTLFFFFSSLASLAHKWNLFKFGGYCVLSSMLDLVCCDITHKKGFGIYAVSTNK